MISKEKAEEILKMEREMRSLDDEDIFMCWLMCGVPDGDINRNTTYEEVMGMYDNEDYKMFKAEYEKLKKYL